MSGIILSKKHGVNPSMLLCSICYKEYAVGLLGRIKGDVKAPKNVVAGICDDCKDKLKDNVVIRRCRSNGEFTGEYVFVKRDCIKEEHKGSIFNMETELFDKMFSKIKETKEN